MFEYDKVNNQIIIKGYSYFKIGGFFTLAMAFMGIRLLFGLVPFEEGYTGADVFGLIFVCIWVLGVLSTSVAFFSMGGRKIILSDAGVLSKSWFKEELLDWSDIEDYGLSYCGQTKGEGNTYYLYFSKQAFAVKNNYRKKLKGKMIKTIIMSGDYAEAVNVVIPFCHRRTHVEPFIAIDKHHFI